jgi:regulator of nonsense transcripts 3
MSRAYIAFRTAEELATFSQNYDGHLFRDKQGDIVITQICMTMN